MPLHSATLDDIRANLITDIYFQRTVDILQAQHADTVVTAEVRCSNLPEGYDFGLLCGLEELLEVLQGVPVDVLGLREGSYFRTGEPVLAITGPYCSFARLETAILGLVCQASGVATRAARCKLAAGERLLISFGARRMHPTLAPMIERNAYVGGCDGFSVVKAADLIGIPASGTMPHALIIVAGSLATALLWFDAVVDPVVPRIALIDTFQDEKFDALTAAETLGEKLLGVRLDTPGSRRGDMLELLREVRWELDLRGHRQVKLLVSGGLDEREILRLNELADGYGVGTAIAGAPVIDFALDIVAIGERPLAKRGKPSGHKQLLACPSCHQRLVVPRDKVACHLVCDCGEKRQELLVPLLAQGERVLERLTVQQIKEHCWSQVQAYVGSLNGRSCGEEV